jgi:hypothetical protein
VPLAGLFGKAGLPLPAIVRAEPLDDAGANWGQVSEGYVLVAEWGTFETRPFMPVR